MHDSKVFRDTISAYVGEMADPSHDFFVPHAVIRQISRERVLYLGGMRALLMQVAHPKVAQGVAEHSHFQEDPLRRGLHTLGAVQTMVFGTRQMALRAATRVHAMHVRVQGEGYAALDPQLLLWVYATLVDSTLVTYETFVASLTPAAREQFYQESRRVGPLFGLEAPAMPETLADFYVWMRATLASGAITVTPAALAIKDALFGCSPLVRAMMPFNYVLAAGLLPPPLRDGFGLRWNWAMRLAFGAGALFVRTALPRLPRWLRFNSAAREAQRRLETQRGLQGRWA